MVRDACFRSLAVGDRGRPGLSWHLRGARSTTVRCGGFRAERRLRRAAGRPPPARGGARRVPGRSIYTLSAPLLARCSPPGCATDTRGFGSGLAACLRAGPRAVVPFRCSIGDPCCTKGITKHALPLCAPIPSTHARPASRPVLPSARSVPSGRVNLWPVGSSGNWRRAVSAEIRRVLAAGCHCHPGRNYR